MAPAPWPRVEELYHAALEKPTDEREAFLDQECGENEALAVRCRRCSATNLLERLVRQHCRLIDVICADALYLEAPFLERVLDAGKHFVVVMKQEARDLYQDADRLRGLIKPQILVDGPRTTRLWDIPNLSSFSTLDREVRVVWAEEQTHRHRILGGKTTDVVEEKTWVWVTDLPGATVPPTKIQPQTSSPSTPHPSRPRRPHGRRPHSPRRRLRLAGPTNPRLSRPPRRRDVRPGLDSPLPA